MAVLRAGPRLRCVLYSRHTARPPATRTYVCSNTLATQHTTCNRQISAGTSVQQETHTSGCSHVWCTGSLLSHGMGATTINTAQAAFAGPLPSTSDCSQDTTCSHTPCTPPPKTYQLWVPCSLHCCFNSRFQQSCCFQLSRRRCCHCCQQHCCQLPLLL